MTWKFNMKNRYEKMYYLLYVVTVYKKSIYSDIEKTQLLI